MHGVTKVRTTPAPSRRYGIQLRCSRRRYSSPATLMHCRRRPVTRTGRPRRSTPSRSELTHHLRPADARVRWLLDLAASFEADGEVDGAPCRTGVRGIARRGV